MDPETDHDVGYGRPDAESLRGYVGVMAAYAAVVGGLGALARRRGVQLPDRIAPGDLALLAVATHKVSRTVTKEGADFLHYAYTRAQRSAH